jgi:hypothetical protein
LMAPIPSASGSNIGWRWHLPCHFTLSIFSISRPSYRHLDTIARCRICLMQTRPPSAQFSSFVSSSGHSGGWMAQVLSYLRSASIRDQ